MVSVAYTDLSLPWSASIGCAMVIARSLHVQHKIKSNTYESVLGVITLPWGCQSCLFGGHCRGFAVIHRPFAHAAISSSVHPCSSKNATFQAHPASRGRYREGFGYVGRSRPISSSWLKAVNVSPDCLQSSSTVNAMHHTVPPPATLICCPPMFTWSGATNANLRTRANDSTARR